MRWDRGNIKTLQVDVEGKSEVWHSGKSSYETGEREHYAALHIEVDCKPKAILSYLVTLSMESNFRF